MHSCIDCGKDTVTFYSSVGPLCADCRQKRDDAKIIEKSQNVQKCSDFKEWSGHDLSELFWIHLGKYRKEPSAESYHWMEMAFRWACHADHGLSSSFWHALKWAGIDLLEESRKWRKSC